MTTDQLDASQIDILGEIANISIGNAATTLSMMVNHKVDITMPRVGIVKRSEVLDDYEKTCVFVQIHYIKGLSGNNVFILKEPDVLCMTDLMMGGPGNKDGEIGELQMSAISEAMNQMMGASATSMSVMLNEMVDISTPDVNTIDVDSVKTFEKIFDNELDLFVKIAFKMDIEGLIDSTMVQFYPISFAKEMCRVFVENKDKM
ncbi:MAG: flagellar motor switch phosphatase FliY [Lachnospiraceae bacterium]|nr:flagellar motor switch phosphatase FliY [Lachnospiraceae bacterium]